MFVRWKCNANIWVQLQPHNKSVGCREKEWVFIRFSRVAGTHQSLPNHSCSHTTERGQSFVIWFGQQQALPASQPVTQAAQQADRQTEDGRSNLPSDCRLSLTLARGQFNIRSHKPNPNRKPNPAQPSSAQPSAALQFRRRIVNFGSAILLLCHLRTPSLDPLIQSRL